MPWRHISEYDKPVWPSSPNASGCETPSGQVWHIHWSVVSWSAEKLVLWWLSFSSLWYVAGGPPMTFSDPNIDILIVTDSPHSSDYWWLAHSVQLCCLLENNCCFNTNNKNFNLIQFLLRGCSLMTSPFLGSPESLRLRPPLSISVTFSRYPKSQGWILKALDTLEASNASSKMTCISACWPSETAVTRSKCRLCYAKTTDHTSDSSSSRNTFSFNVATVLPRHFFHRRSFSLNYRLKTGGQVYLKQL